MAYQPWVEVSAVLTEDQFWAGARALALPGLRDARGRAVVTPVLRGPHRAGFVVSYAAMLDAAPAPPAECRPRTGWRWVPATATDEQTRAALRLDRLTPKYAARVLADPRQRQDFARMYAAMNAAGGPVKPPLGIGDEFNHQSTRWQLSDRTPTGAIYADCVGPNSLLKFQTCWLSADEFERQTGRRLTPEVAFGDAALCFTPGDAAEAQRRTDAGMVWQPVTIIAVHGGGFLVRFADGAELPRPKRTVRPRLEEM